jgi:hypothetical protein
MTRARLFISYAEAVISIFVELASIVPALEVTPMTLGCET